MKTGWKITSIVSIILIFTLLVGPLVIPIPPLENTSPPAALADPDSNFIEINGLSVHYKMMGEGEPVFILLHGFGASTFSWREVMGPLSEYGTLIAYDRPAFGLTERPVEWEGVNPYSEESNLAILAGLMDEFQIEKVILVGNSAGGTLATSFALANPDRVQALIEVDAAIYQTRPQSAFLTWLFNTPQIDRLGPWIARSIAGGSGDDFLQGAWYDASKLESDPEILAGYRKPLMVDNWDKALWEHTQATTAPGLADRLKDISVPTLVISGAYDQIVPLENSRQLAEDIPGAALVVIDACGHVPQEECPQVFVQAVIDFVNSLKEN